jgi:hypothetical protein
MMVGIERQVIDYLTSATNIVNKIHKRISVSIMATSHLKLALGEAPQMSHILNNSRQ